eukprot:gene6289-7540_t
MELDARSLGGVPGCETTTTTPLHNVCSLSRALVPLAGCFHQTPLDGLDTYEGEKVVMAHQSPMSFLNGEFTFRVTVLPTNLSPTYSLAPVLFGQHPLWSSAEKKGFSIGGNGVASGHEVAFGDGLHQASCIFTFPSAPSAGTSINIELHCEIVPEVWGSDAVVIVTSTLSSTSVPFMQTITADMDSDGHLDVLFGSALSRSVLWYRNAGNGSFSSSTSISDKMQELPALSATNFAHLASLEVGDLDLDGDPDLIMTTGDESVGYADRIALIPNLGTSGTGLWGYYAIWKNGYDHLGAVHAADLDGDGDLDLIYGRTDGANVIVLWNDCVLLSNGECDAWVHAAWERSSQPADAWSSGGSTVLASADMNGDLVADIVAASSDNDLIVCWYGSSAPGAQVVYTSAAVVVSQAVVDGPRSISLVDIDGDNDLDVFVRLFECQASVVLLRSGNESCCGDYSFVTGDWTWFTAGYLPISQGNALSTVTDAVDPAACMQACLDRTAGDCRAVAWNSLSYSCYLKAPSQSPVEAGFCSAQLTTSEWNWYHNDAVCGVQTEYVAINSIASGSVLVSSTVTWTSEHLASGASPDSFALTATDSPATIFSSSSLLANYTVSSGSLMAAAEPEVYTISVDVASFPPAPPPPPPMLCADPGTCFPGVDCKENASLPPGYTCGPCPEGAPPLAPNPMSEHYGALHVLGAADSAACLGCEELVFDTCLIRGQPEAWRLLRDSCVSASRDGSNSRHIPATD